jgi:alpha-amylase/alpha-mannosidase (GH57 family)
MYWANFLHIYQPPTQKELWIRRITDSSYRKIFSGLLAISQARLTINISGVLCDFLDSHGGKDVLQMIKELADRGTLELTGSAQYHAFLPLLPEDQIERQILLNEKTLTKYFGPHWKKGGFFPPEMAYSEKVAKVAKRLGYTWLIIDEFGFPAGTKLQTDSLYTIHSSGLGVFFRQRHPSFGIISSQTSDSVADLIKRIGLLHTGKGEYVVTAMDGEMFGHHRPGLEQLFFDLLKSPSVHTVTLGDLNEKIQKKTVIEPQDSTWAVTKKDISAGTPFSRWKSKKNQIQLWQWELTELAIAIANREKQNSKAQTALDKAIHSDQYWWACARPWWSIEMIERGVFELQQLIDQSPTATAQEKKRALEIYTNILFLAFTWQRTGLVDMMAKEDDEELQQRREEKEGLLLTKADYEKMIAGWTSQMEDAIKDKQYHRAGAIQDRIQELKEDLRKNHESSQK